MHPGSGTAGGLRKVNQMKAIYLCFALTVSLIFIILSCGDEAANENGGCAEGTLACGDVCCPGDASEYACSSGNCVLISCDTGLFMCGPGCIPATADCCDQTTGTYCQSEICCDAGCMPIGASCCGNNTWCPSGSVCCGGGCC